MRTFNSKISKKTNSCRNSNVVTHLFRSTNWLSRATTSSILQTMYTDQYVFLICMITISVRLCNITSFHLVYLVQNQTLKLTSIVKIINFLYFLLFSIYGTCQINKMYSFILNSLVICVYMYLLQSYYQRAQGARTFLLYIYMRDIYLYEIKAMYFEKLRK